MPVRPVPVPARLALLVDVCAWLRDQAEVPSSWTVEAGSLELLAELSRPELGRVLADLQAVLSPDGVTLARVRALHHLDESRPAARYLTKALAGAAFQEQLGALSGWASAPAERIAAVEALLSALFQADVEHVVPEPALLTGLSEADRAEISQGMARRASAIGLAPRRLWSAAMAVWRPDPWAREATLTARAAAFRDLLDENQGPPKVQSTDGPAPRRRAGRDPAHGEAVQPEIRLSRDQVQDLWDAAAFAVQMRGRYLNASILLDHVALGQGGETQAQKLVTDLLSELKKRGLTRRRRDPARDFYWLYVHDRDGAGGLQTRIVLHVPSTMRDFEPWLRNRFMVRHRGQVPSQNAVVVRLAREDHQHPLRRHLTLLRLLCRGVDPSIRVVIDVPQGERQVALAKVLGVPNFLRRGLGSLTEIRRFETSRWIARDARKEATVRLSFLSAFAEGAWQASARGYDREEHDARAAVLAALDHVEQEFPSHSDSMWQSKREARQQKIRDVYVKAARARLRAACVSLDKA